MTGSQEATGSSPVCSILFIAENLLQVLGFFLCQNLLHGDLSYDKKAPVHEKKYLSIEQQVRNFYKPLYRNHSRLWPKGGKGLLWKRKEMTEKKEELPGK